MSAGQGQAETCAYTRSRRGSRPTWLSIFPGLSKRLRFPSGLRIFVPIDEMFWAKEPKEWDVRTKFN